MFVAGGIGELVWQYFRRHLPLYLALLILFSTGLAFGAIATQKLSEDQKEDLTGYLSGIYSSIKTDNSSVLRRGQTFYNELLDSIIKTTGLLFVLGLTVIGAPLIFGVVFLRGFVLGFALGFLVQDTVVNGLILSTASILPHNLLAVPACLIGAAGALSFAGTALKTLLGMSREGVYAQFASTTFLSLCSCLLLILATLVETYLTPIFIRLSGVFLT